MATFQDDIIETIKRAKCVAVCWGNQSIDRHEAGENVKCCEQKTYLLSKWIQTMEDWYCYNYDENGIVEEPDITCLSTDQAQELLSKIKKLADL